MSEDGDNTVPFKPAGQAGGPGKGGKRKNNTPGGALIPENLPPGAPVDLRCAVEPCNDLGNAARFIHRYGDDFRFVEGVGWAAWDGVRWDVEDGGRAAHLAAQATAEAVRAEAGAVEFSAMNLSSDLADWVVDAGSSGRVHAMLREAAPRLAVKVDDLDADPDLIATPGGTVHLETGEMRENRRGDLLSHATVAEYDPKAECPEFEKFLGLILPDPNIMEFLIRVLGYGLTGHTREQVMVCLKGTGGNGKSVLRRCLDLAVGRFAQTMPVETILRKTHGNAGGPSPDLARLPGVRMAFTSEPQVGAQLDEGRIKELTGGEPMAVRKLNRDYFEFTPQLKLFLSFNNRPVIRDASDGIWRRLLVVPFKEKLAQEDAARVLRAVETVEAPGVLRRLIDGAKDWAAEGLRPPEGVQAATGQYRQDSDPLGMFISEYMEEAPGDSVRAKSLRQAFDYWCDLADVPHMTARAFGGAMTDKSFDRKKVGRDIVYLDWRLREDLVAEMEQKASPPPVESRDDYLD